MLSMTSFLPTPLSLSFSPPIFHSSAGVLDIAVCLSVPTAFYLCRAVGPGVVKAGSNDVLASQVPQRREMKANVGVGNKVLTCREFAEGWREKRKNFTVGYPAIS